MGRLNEFFHPSGKLFDFILKVVKGIVVRCV